MYDPREHIHEDPRNQSDSTLGFAIFFGFSFLLAAAATVASVL
ncbi:YqzM family protein [Paenibacillus mesotrionivorans]|uniref:YqzM family protein n=1 Tax=Paenibacillus mesotrionivorans TaxID=3160968 RepID=A0ACC7NUI1_9BACL